MASRIPALPKTLAGVADLMYETREKRLALQKDVDALSSLESQCAEHLIANLPKSKAEGITGRVAQAQIVVKAIPTVKDWAKLQLHILKTKSFDLLQRRVNTAAVKERWEKKHVVPGVEPFNVVTVSLTRKPAK